MKRTQDKVKDFVEPQSFDDVQNAAADPPRALAAYRFTDATSDLIARWVDALADLPRGHGTAKALAGARGVGKSHTLAVFSALAASPDLRSSVTDAHVSASARRLLNRRYTIVRVERGARATLPEELAAAFASAFGGDEGQWRRAPGETLAVAASRAAEATLVVVIDTAFGRAARVHRDDGPILSELAAAAQNASAFVALALDDDIADASGINARLAAAYQIDYLDSEHLFRVADLYLLRKNHEARAALHEMYLSLRASVARFNWSEPRFAALYPLHPLVADVTTAVRLYEPTFALLPFAATAARRALGRPALSLILLDEVFDHSEENLRRAEDLTEAFTAYDELSVRGVQQFPVMQRLQAKLLLKSLFILSLDGRAASAGDLCAALLFSDGTGPGPVVDRVDEMLNRFADSAPPGLWERIDEGGESRHRFRIGASARFDAALASSVERAASGRDTVNAVLGAMARARFEDWPLPEENAAAAAAGPTKASTAAFQIKWRGTERPGQILFHASANAQSSDNELPAPQLIDGDWQLFVRAPGRHGGESTEDSPPLLADPDPVPDRAKIISIIWRPAALTEDEDLILRRLLALRADSSLTADFADKARVATSALTAQAERIWTRVYLDEGTLAVDGEPRVLTDAARAAAKFTDALSLFLAPIFDERFPEHPVFGAVLAEAEVAQLIDGFFNSGGAAAAEARGLVQHFALPLGLATVRNQSYTLETGDEALGRPWVRDVLTLTDQADGRTVPLDVVDRTLRRKPYGLLRETQHLILAALVAQRRIELVTATGDRIGRRTLGRSIKWEEIAGVCRTAVIHHSAEELTEWARLLTGNEALGTIADPAPREAVRVALAEWLDSWRTHALLEHFNALPDTLLTTRAAGLATAVRKSFGASANAVEAALAGDVPLEEGLQRVADAFHGAADSFTRNSEHLADLAAFTFGIEEREWVRSYLTAAEVTTEEEIESARRELLTIADDSHSLFDHERRGRFDLLWQEFHARYIEHYSAMHDRFASDLGDRRALNTLMHSDEWRAFEAFSRLSILNRRYWTEAQELLAGAYRLPCDLAVRELLVELPRCVCSFGLARTGALAHLVEELKRLAELGNAASRRTLELFREQLQYALTALALHESTSAGAAAKAGALARAFSEGAVPDKFSLADIRLLARATELMEAPPPVRVRLPTAGCGLLTREELSARLRQWLDELPDHTALVEVVGDSDGA